jgi:hypothetical protein
LLKVAAALAQFWDFAAGAVRSPQRAPVAERGEQRDGAFDMV